MEDFVNYRLPSMFLISSFCDWKCCVEGGFPNQVCQNNSIISLKIKQHSYYSIFNAYMSNNISKAIVVGGLEPFNQFDEMYGLIEYFRRNGCFDKFVIYTGYYKTEILEQIQKLKELENIIVKFGRYIPNNEPHFDGTLGINLASDNQYAEEL